MSSNDRLLMQPYASDWHEVVMSVKTKEIRKGRGHEVVMSVKTKEIRKGRGLQTRKNNNREKEITP